MTAEAMRESAIRLRVATEGAGLGLYEFDFTRGVVWFDTRAIEAYHYLQPSGAWLPIDGPECVAVLARFHPDDRIRLDTALANFADGSADNVALECRVRGRDGNWHWIWTQGTALERHRTTGRPLRLVGIIQDVTARRRLEAQITRA
jgi:PAS domain-containing protein